MPRAVGLPESTPDDDTVMPGGRVPADEIHDFAPYPPVAPSVTLYVLERLAAGSDVVDTASVTTVTPKVNDLDTGVPNESVTVTV